MTIIVPILLVPILLLVLCGEIFDYKIIVLGTNQVATRDVDEDTFRAR